jgi:hypothetical protein
MRRRARPSAQTAVENHPPLLGRDLSFVGATGLVDSWTLAPRVRSATCDESDGRRRA